MKHQQTLFILLSFVAMVFNLQSCRPRDGEDCPVLKDIVHKFSAADERIIPYTGYDTLYFLNKQGDTCMVRGTGKQYYIETELESMRAGCPPQRTVSDAYKIDFVSVKGGFDFYIIKRIVYNNVYIGRRAMKYVFTVNYYTLGKPVVINEYYFDTVTINGYAYPEVNKTRLLAVMPNSTSGGHYTIEDTTYQLLVNRYNGVLLFKNDNTNEYYTLIQKP